MILLYISNPGMYFHRECHTSHICWNKASSNVSLRIEIKYLLMCCFLFCLTRVSNKVHLFCIFIIKLYVWLLYILFKAATRNKYFVLSCFNSLSIFKIEAESLNTHSSDLLIHNPVQYIPYERHILSSWTAVIGFCYHREWFYGFIVPTSPTTYTPKLSLPLYQSNC